jgi:activator of HSP90 ATPase
MRVEGSKAIRDKCGAYLRSLKEEYSKDLILPTTKTDSTKSGNINGHTTNGQQKKSLVEQVKELMVDQQEPTNKPTSTTSNINPAVKIPTTKLNLVETFKCKAYELYNCFTDINVSWHLLFLFA